MPRAKKKPEAAPAAAPSTATAAETAAVPQIGKRVLAEHTLSRCPKCGSTDRTPYNNRREQRYGGTLSNGQRFTHVVRQNTTCATCHQARTDRTFEYDPEAWIE